MTYSWRDAPVTTILIVIQVVVFLAMTFAGGSTNTAVLLHFGANNAALVRAGQYWRLLTAGFVHIGTGHLVINSITLFFIGYYVERLFGHWRMLVIYLVSVLTGNLFSNAFLTNGMAAGSSTGIFGLFGAFLLLGMAFHDNMAIRSVARQFLLLVVFNLITDVFMPGIDLAGHLGGLVGGFLMAAVVAAPRLGRIDLLKRLLSGIILLVAIFVFGGMGLR